MTVEENLQLGTLARGLRRDAKSWELEDVFALFPILRERRGQMAGSLSGGEQQMLAIGRALMGRPKLLLLDEPSLGLSPLMVKTVFAVLTKLNAAGLTILLIEQNARMALQCAHYAYVIDRGRITLEGAARALLNDPRVTEHYLGG
jgi:branched-chain amino acid transport system ATP-binding protein